MPPDEPGFAQFLMSMLQAAPQGLLFLVGAHVPGAQGNNISNNNNNNSPPGHPSAASNQRSTHVSTQRVLIAPSAVHCVVVCILVFEGRGGIRTNASPVFAPHSRRAEQPSWWAQQALLQPGTSNQIGEAAR